MSSEPARTPSRILRLRTVIELTGLSRSTIYLRIANGDFPRQVPLGGRAIGWRESDVYRWLEALQEKG